MSSVLPLTLEEQKLIHENKITRLVKAKELEREWSKEIIELYKYYLDQKSRQKDYMKIIEKYKNLLNEIDSLKLTKENIIKNYKENLINKEKEKKLFEENLKKIEQKRLEFEQFMNKKGKEALQYFRNLSETKKKLYEEIHQLKSKQIAKEKEKNLSEKIVYNYLANEQRKQNQNINGYLQNDTMNYIYKTIQPFHNNNQNVIDYSTTNFHNIVIQKNVDQKQEDEYIKNFQSAFDNAKIEKEKLIKREKDKEIRLKNFNEFEEKNYQEIIRKMRAEENLKRLNKELKRNYNRKNLPQNPNQNIINAKMNDRRAENIMDKLLNEQQKNRQNILMGYNNNGYDNNNNIIGGGIIQPQNYSIASDASMIDFYQDSQTDKNFLDRFKDFENEDEKNKINNKYLYEEPIARDRFPLKEKINRTSPVDLPAYQKSEFYEDYNIVHKEPLVPIPAYKKKLNNSTLMAETTMLGQDTSKFSVLDALNISSVSSIVNKSKENKSVITASEDVEGNKKVNEFMNKVKESNINNIPNNNNIKRQTSIASTSLWNIDEEVEGPLSTSEKNNNDNNPNIKSNISNKKIVKININKKNENKIEDVLTPKFENEDIINNNNLINNNKKEEESKKDEKWKYNKKELFERKKKMLKDKSNFQN